MSRARLSAMRSSTSVAGARRVMGGSEAHRADGMRGSAGDGKDSFERFYLTKVALGDCCGCAERVIDWRDIEHAARSGASVCEGERGPRISMTDRARAWVAGLLRMAGIKSTGTV